MSGNVVHVHWISRVAIVGALLGSPVGANSAVLEIEFDGVVPSGAVDLAGLAFSGSILVDLSSSTTIIGGGGVTIIPNEGSEFELTLGTESSTHSPVPFTFFLESQRLVFSLRIGAVLSGPFGLTLASLFASPHEGLEPFPIGSLSALTALDDDCCTYTLELSDDEGPVVEAPIDSLVVVPEPGPGAMMAVGAALLIALHRSRGRLSR